MATHEESIESSLARLEKIVEEIENNPPPLEDLIQRYEEGMNLLMACRKKINLAEKKIEMITQKSEISKETEDFEP